MLSNLPKLIAYLTSLSPSASKNQSPVDFSFNMLLTLTASFSFHACVTFCLCPCSSLLTTLLSPAYLGFSISKYPNITARVQREIHCHNTALAISRLPYLNCSLISPSCYSIRTKRFSLTLTVFRCISSPALAVSLTLHDIQTLISFVL